MVRGRRPLGEHELLGGGRATATALRSLCAHRTLPLGAPPALSSDGLSGNATISIPKVTHWPPERSLSLRWFPPLSPLPIPGAWDLCLRQDRDQQVTPQQEAAVRMAPWQEGLQNCPAMETPPQG